MKFFSKFIPFTACALAVAGITSEAMANSVEAVPTTWRLENYISSHSVMLWYTGVSECTNNGGIGNSTMSQDDYNRLWSLIMTSKITNRTVGIIYTASGGTCTIVSFYAV